MVLLAQAGGNVVEKTQSSLTVIFDLEGNKTEITTYTADNIVSGKIEFSYDAARKLAEKMHYDADGSLRFRETFAHGKRVGSVEYSAEGSLHTKEIFNYDVKGRLTGRTLYNANGSPVEEAVINYDAEGNRIEQENLPEKARAGCFDSYVADRQGNKIDIYTEGAYTVKRIYSAEGDPLEIIFNKVTGHIINRYVFSHDGMGRVTRVAQYIGCAALEGDLPNRWLRPLVKVLTSLKTICAYSIQGNFSKAVGSVANGIPLTERVYIYDPKGRLIKESVYFTGSVSMKTVYSYDPRGNKIEEVSYNASGDLQYRQSFSREFDARGNWIKETVSQQSARSRKARPIVVTTVTYRDISYY